jgi:gliding motility-associated-like protein
MLARITNWSWDFGDSVTVSNLNPAFHTYSRTGTFNVKLKFTDLNGCDDSVTNIVTVKVAELDIPNLFTPNADGVNDKFAIELMDDKKKDFREAYLGNELLVYDRWGKKVFNKVDYKSDDWDGERLSDGTYFYILRLTGQFGDEVLKGSVTILRGS